MYKFEIIEFYTKPKQEVINHLFPIQNDFYNCKFTFQDL